MSALDGKVALVTGGASGIGLATARLLRSEGARLVIVDLDEEAGRAAAAELDGRFVRFDVAEPDRWGEAVRAIEAELGGLDIAHLNAGVATGTAVLREVGEATYRRVMRANVDGVFFGAQAVAPAMARRGGGAIVATASIAGLIAYEPDPLYAMTKHAVVGLVRSLAPQLARESVHINAVCPGMVDTQLVGEEARALMAAAAFPFIDPADVARVVLECILGEETGQALVVQVGLGGVAYRFSGVPGPRGERAGSKPPAGLAGS